MSPEAVGSHTPLAVIVRAVFTLNRTKALRVSLGAISEVFCITICAAQLADLYNACANNALAPFKSVKLIECKNRVSFMQKLA